MLGGLNSGRQRARGLLFPTKMDKSRCLIEILVFSEYFGLIVTVFSTIHMKQHMWQLLGTAETTVHSIGVLKMAFM